MIPSAVLPSPSSNNTIHMKDVVVRHRRFGVVKHYLDLNDSLRGTDIGRLESAFMLE